MRRAIAWLAGVGFGALLLAIALWHVERTDPSVCVTAVPCDPRVYLPFGNLAAALTVVGTVAIVAAAVLLLLRLVVWARDADVRSVRGVSGDHDESSFPS